MSRIYDALRLAEAERAAGKKLPVESARTFSQAIVDFAWKEPLVAQADPAELSEEWVEVPAGGSPGDEPVLEHAAAAGVPAKILAPPTPAAALVSAPLPEAALAEPLSTAQSAVSVAEIDFDTIASSPWTPVLEHLPSVQERGRTVEQFRSLRSRMQEIRGANRVKSILVTSGLPQEGKSFVAVNLALSLARHKISRVLLIDGDMRRSSLHKVLGCPNDGPGLTEYLSGQATLQQIIKRPEADPGGAPMPHGFASLVFIGAGREADKAADLSGNHRFEELVATVSPLFDWVIVDSSPVNLVSDGVNLARACDGVLLIARGSVTKFESAQQAVAALEASKILGFVLNAVNTSFASSGYYDYDSAAEKGN